MTYPTPPQRRILRSMAQGGAITDDYANRHTLMVGEESHGRVTARMLECLHEAGWIMRNAAQLRYEITDAGRAAVAACAAGGGR